MKYRKLPVEIEAIQYDGYRGTMEQIVESFGPDYRHETHGNDFHDVLCRFWICTLEGEMRVATDDYVIKGVKGEVYPCKPDIFEMTYELVSQ